MRPDDERYFEGLEAGLEDALAVAERARAEGRDPETDVEIPIARDMADRVEKVLGIDGVAERVRELEGEMSREEAALELAADFAEGRVGDYDTRAGKIEGAVRTAVALLTEGVVAAPIEGIDRVELVENDDGSECVAIYYAGPIRSAGGTAQALSVLVADYVRSLLDVAEYAARDAEVGRYAEEVALYDADTGLQYSPKEAETEFIAEHVPIMLDGEATGDEEVDSYRDLDRVDTNSPRGGMCLVLAEGIALKAPKIKRYTRDLEEVAWPWLDDLMEGTYADGHGEEEQKDGAAEGADDADGDDGEDDTARDGPPRAEKNGKFLRDLIAGRPVFTHPSEPGGFRLRYGRARNHGHATAGVHPATMHLLDDFLATGTQIKTERPGKAAGVVPVDSIEGPTVRLANGEVRYIDDPAEAKEIRNGVEAVLDLGEYLVNYGEFVENNHPLVPGGYAFEWWVQEFAEAGADVQALADDPRVDLEHPTEDRAIEWAREHDAPLHPEYTYPFHDLPVDEFEALAAAVADGAVAETDGASQAPGDAGGDRPGRGDLVLERTETTRRALETLLVEHHQTDDELRVPAWRALALSLGVTENLERTWDSLPDAAREYDGGENAIEAARAVAPFALRERAPTRVGNRMGRPEKSESRELSPAVHALFPLGEAGGAQRDVAKAADSGDSVGEGRGRVELDVGTRACPDCGTRTWRNRCEDCGAHTEPRYRCPDCGQTLTADESGRVECGRCDRAGTTVESRTVDVRSEYQNALVEVGERETAFDVLKGVKGLSSAHKTPEPLEKGVLRAKHGVSAFKDGTVRYDMTDLPVTAVRPDELDVTPEQLQELGYDTDVDGEPLRRDDQLVGLRVQDVVLSEGAADHMLATADFVDDLLEQFYGLEPFYEVDSREDLVGELVFGMAPHTSAAVVGRVAGFTDAQVGYAHPYFHAAKRRNCFHPDTKLWYEDDDGELVQEPIREFVESRLEDPREDDFGTLVEDLDGELRVPSVTENGNLARKSVEAVSKHVAPDHMVQLTTEAGRSLAVTPDHSMLRWKDGRLERVPAAELTEGDELPDSGLGGGASQTVRAVADGGHPDVGRDGVASVEYVESSLEYTYNLTVADTHTVVANGVGVAQCDGDEDCVMLLLDGLLNFSEQYLPDQRGGRMDAPLVMSTRIDPAEIDDEAHNVDVVEQYPLELYEAAREMADPEDVDVTIAEEWLGTDEEYATFGHTHDTANIAAGPPMSAYKTLGSMMDKMEAQLELARKTRAVDETDVAERVIESHFLPDLLGNLRAFASQETRCLDCGEKYRRPPLSGDCRECGGDVNLTVHRGSVNKYMDVALRVAEEYGTRAYTVQRLEILRESLESIFEDDTNKQSGIADFM
jgi:DNA polymerase II large subunit